MLADGHDSFLELGPGPMLSAAVESVAAAEGRSVSVAVASTDLGDEVAALNWSLAALHEQPRRCAQL